MNNGLYIMVDSDLEQAVYEYLLNTRPEQVDRGLSYETWRAKLSPDSAPRVNVVSPPDMDMFLKENLAMMYVYNKPYAFGIESNMLVGPTTFSTLQGLVFFIQMVLGYLERKDYSLFTDWEGL